ncbi:MAG: mechanosensitive ion channel [Acidobacteriota bacterium]|nr:mechanosensitive ion channel [Acidobacteriota bacterium]
MTQRIQTTLSRAAVLLALLAGVAGAQERPASRVPEDLRSPRTTLGTFLGEQLRPEIDWDSVAATLDFDESTSPEERQAVATQLKSVLDGRGLFVRMDSVPADPEYLDPESREAAFTPFPIRLPEFQLRRGDDLAWRISGSTVRAAGTLYEATFSWYARRLLDLLPPVVERSFLGFTLWQLIGLAILAVLAWIAQRFLRIFFRGFLVRLASRGSNWAAEELGAAALPASWLATVWIFRRFLADLRFPVLVNQVLNVLLDLTLAGISVWFAFRAIEAVCSRLEAIAARTETNVDDHLVPLARTVLRVGSVVVAFLLIAQSQGYSITTLVAGLGLGGLAIALAAQDTLANVLGSLAIVGDRPFQVGDWVLVDGYEGTVERVGLRSTRVRTFYDSVVSVPNSKVVNSIVDNMGQRKFRRMKHMLALRYDTDPDRIQEFVDGIRSLILKNPAMRHDYFEIHLNRFADSSVDILVYCFFRVPNWHEELSERHNFLLSILRLAKEIGVDFAFPTRTLALEHPPGDGDSLSADPPGR